MLPTLIGRWQSRLFLFSTVGVIVTLLFGAIYNDFHTVFALLAYVLGFGLIWDIINRFIAYFRWDADWPPALLLLTGIFEGLSSGYSSRFSIPHRVWRMISNSVNSSPIT